MFNLALENTKQQSTSEQDEMDISLLSQLACTDNFVYALCRG